MASQPGSPLSGRLIQKERVAESYPTRLGRGSQQLKSTLGEISAKCEGCPYA
jgi:hypothetical protein